MKKQIRRKNLLVCATCIILAGLITACGDTTEADPSSVAPTSIGSSANSETLLSPGSSGSPTDSVTGLEGESPSLAPQNGDNAPDLSSLSIEQADYQGDIVSLGNDTFSFNPTLQDAGGDFEAVAVGDDAAHLTVSYSDSTIIKVFNYHSDPSKDNFTDGDNSALAANRTVSIWGQQEGDTIVATVIAVWKKAD